MTAPREILACAALAVVLLGASAARAQSDPEKRAAAQALFDEAKRLTDAKDYAGACPKFLESYKLDPAMGTKFYLARCYEQIGKLASAWSYYLEVVDDAHKEGAADKEKFANDRAAALKPRLPRLTVSVAAAGRKIAGLSVKRDGIPVGEGSWETPLPVDLGDHAITASAPGRKTFETHVEAKDEGGTVRVEIPALEPLPAPVADVPVKPPGDPVDHPEPPASRWSSKQAIAGYALSGAGLVGVAIGLGFGGVAMSKQSSSNSNGCNAMDVCTAGGQALRTDAIHAATISTATFVVGGVLLGTGIIVIATTPAPKSAPVHAGFGIGPANAAILGSF